MRLISDDRDVEYWVIYPVPALPEFKGGYTVVARFDDLDEAYDEKDAAQILVGHECFVVEVKAQ